MTYLVWLESTALATWVRESGSLFSYSGILFLHTLGMGMLVGTNILIDLFVWRASNVSDQPLDGFYRVMWAGFWINAGSGSLLLIADATTKLTNPVFYIKMTCVGLAVLNMVLIRRRVIRTPEGGRTRHRFLALSSLVLWTAAITAGRLMAYLGPVSGAPGLTN